MPFQSKRQARWAYATGQPFAKRWGKQTRFRGLPEQKDAGITAGAQAHGPGGLLATSGMGLRRWGNRRKDAGCTCGMNVATKEQLAPGITRIRGNLCNVHGRYGPCDASAAGKKPKVGKGRAAKPKKPVLTPEQRASARAAEQAANRTKVLSGLGIAPDGQAALEALRSGTQADPDAIARGGFVKAGLAEQAADGSYRLTPSGRAALAAAASGDAGRAGDIISGARDRTGARQTRQDAAAERKRAAEAKRATAQAAKKPAPGGKGGKGSSGTADREAQRQADREQRASEHAADRAKRIAEHDADRAKREAERVADRQRKLDEAAASRFNIPSATASPPPPRRVPRARSRVIMPTRPRQTTKAATKAPRYIRATNRPDLKSFAVFKDDTDAYRWVARTTTAYRDRDGEIITTKALERDAERMTATKQYGPLRYWHIGQPDPFDALAPWGQGLDIGDTDYSIVIGRTSIESGTFKSHAIGKAFSESAGEYELSPGFFHPPDEPNVAGEYGNIRRFERSVVPIKYGRASNLFTGMTVKEHNMDDATYKARVDAFLKDMNSKGVPEQVAAGALAGMQQADKSAEQQGIAYKSGTRTADLHSGAVVSYDDGDVLADPWQAVVMALKTAMGVEEKAAPPPMDAEDDPALGGDSGVDEAAEGEPPIADTGDGGGDYLGDMTPDDFRAMMAELLAPVLKMQEMVKSIGDMHGELKGMYGGATTKDDARAAEIATLKAAHDALVAETTTLATKLAQLMGDQPSVTAPADLEAALKSSGPQSPPDPNAPPAPENAIQAIAMGSAPELYGVTGYDPQHGWQRAQPTIPQPHIGGN